MDHPDKYENSWRRDTRLSGFCAAGHVVPTDYEAWWDRDLGFDPLTHCRRIIEWSRSTQTKTRLHLEAQDNHLRCLLPLTPLCDRPDLEAAFKLGGEPAVQAILCEENLNG